MMFFSLLPPPRLTSWRSTPRSAAARGAGARRSAVVGDDRPAGLGEDVAEQRQARHDRAGGGRVEHLGERVEFGARTRVVVAPRLLAKTRGEASWRRTVVSPGVSVLRCFSSRWTVVTLKPGYTCSHSISNSSSFSAEKSHRTAIAITRSSVVLPVPFWPRSTLPARSPALPTRSASPPMRSASLPPTQRPSPTAPGGVTDGREPDVASNPCAHGSVRPWAEVGAIRFTVRPGRGDAPQPRARCVTSRIRAASTASATMLVFRM